MTINDPKNMMTIVRRDLEGGMVEMQILIRCSATTAETLAIETLLSSNQKDVTYVPAHHYQESASN